MRRKKSKPTDMSQLAKTVMPNGFDQVLTGIEGSLNAAQTVIDQSLARSEQLIKNSRAQVNSWTESQSNEQSQALAGEEVQMDEAAKTLHSEEHQAQKKLAQNNQQVHQELKQLLVAQQSAGQQVAEAAQTAMETAMKNMEVQLKTQQQIYQAAILVPGADK